MVGIIIVGSAVIVGESVGLNDGSAVGSAETVGILVVGDTVGSAVLPDLGDDTFPLFDIFSFLAAFPLSVGLMVGISIVGSAVIVGESVGLNDGSIVGSAETVGAMVVGESVGYVLLLLVCVLDDLPAGLCFLALLAVFSALAMGASSSASSR